mgnify:FL=1
MSTHPRSSQDLTEGEIAAIRAKFKSLDWSESIRDDVVKTVAAEFNVYQTTVRLLTAPSARNTLL